MARLQRAAPARAGPTSASPAAHNDDPEQAALAAGLRYVTDARPGIRRRRAGRGFAYLNPDGTRLRDRQELKRIKALAIPPAWRDVWISRVPRGHIQATGRDAKGRKQYVYHPLWRSCRDANKFGRMLAFGAALPAIRARTEADLARPGLPREKVLATVVRLLDATRIRVGNEEYARENGSFGLTTFRNDHVAIAGSKLRFRFRGKSGKEHTVELEDRRLARVVRRLQELPGEDLFEYLDDADAPRAIASDDVNAYLRQISGADFTAKDFRTWSGTVLAAGELKRLGAAESQRLARKNVTRVIEAVAQRLGNTPAVCRKSYVHPAIIDAYLDRSLFAGRATYPVPVGLHTEEADVLALLRALDQRAAEPRKAG